MFIKNYKGTLSTDFGDFSPDGYRGRMNLKNIQYACLKRYMKKNFLISLMINLVHRKKFLFFIFLILLSYSKNIFASADIGSEQIVPAKSLVFRYFQEDGNISPNGARIDQTPHYFLASNPNNREAKEKKRKKKKKEKVYQQENQYVHKYKHKQEGKK